MKANMNRKSPSEMAEISFSIEAEKWVKTSTEIWELDEFISLIPSQMLVNKVYTYQLAIDKKAQLHFESNSKIACLALDITKSAYLTAKEALRIAKHEKTIAIIVAIIATIGVIVTIIARLL